MGWDSFAAFLLVAGTLAQALLQLVEIRTTKQDVLGVWRTEDELLAEVPWWRRRRWRKEFESLRSIEIDREIARIEMALFAWLALSAGASIGFVLTFGS